MSTTVKFYHSAMLGAPALTGNAGAGLDVLDVLAQGFGAAAVDSIVIANSVATVTRSAGHPFEQDAVALIAGAVPAALNGERRVLSATATTYTFDATGIANQTATGAITHKVAPAGWLKKFTGTNTAVYCSASPEATGCLLRVDDSSPSFMRVVGYESMSDVDTGVGAFPSSAQMPGGGWWPKFFRQSASTESSPWFIAADDRMFYLYVQFYMYGIAQTVCFGDFRPTNSADVYSCMLIAASTAHTTGQRHEDAGAGGGGFTWAPKAFTGLGGSAVLNKFFAVPAWWGGPSGGTTHSGQMGIPFPNGPDNRLYTSEFTLGDAALGNYRGNMPGALAICHPGMTSALAHGEPVVDVGGYAGRSFRVVNNGVGAFLVDVTGPWR